MSFWDGPGHVEGLSVSAMKKHKEYKPSFREGGPRWKRLEVLFCVARLVTDHGVKLRKLLKAADRGEALPTALERAQAAEAQAAAAEAKAQKLKMELDAARVEKAKVVDKHRKAAAALKSKNRAVTDARKDTKRKLLGVSKEERKKRLAQAKEARKRIAEKEAEKAAAKAAADIEMLKKRVAAARARARKVEGVAKQAGKRLRRAQKAEARVEELQAALEEEDPEEGDEPEEGVGAAEQASPRTQRKRRRTGRRRGSNGRFEALSSRVRILAWAQLARRVAPSNISANISDALAFYAPEKYEHETLPCERQLQKMRGELTLAGEAMAAYRIALSRRIISFGFDESTKYGLGVLSTNVQLEPHDAPGSSVDIVPRGACLIAGGKATEVSASIEKKIFAHGRNLLRRWKERHEKRYGAGSWARAGGPDPDSLGLHRLTEHTTLVSDTCNAARAAKRMLAEMAETAAKEKIGADAWEALTEAERSSQVATYRGDCTGHLRNIVINAMTLKGTEFLTSELRDDLAEFSSFDRVSVDGIDWIRAAYKEFHGGGEYAKGKGREFVAWLKKNHPDVFFMPFANAHGTRQDITLDGMVPIFANRTLMAEFLNQLVNAPGAGENKLEKFLWRLLRCNEMTALARVCTLFKYVISEPMRWLTGKASKSLTDWSLASSSEMLDHLDAALSSIATDGHALLDPHLDPFAAIEKKQPLFAKHLAEQRTHPMHSRVLAEARSPAGKGNAQATEMVVKLAEVMANAGLAAMHDSRRAIADKLTSQDGANAVGNLETAHEHTKGAHQMNDHVESNFGCYDNVAHMFRYATVENLSGMAQQMRNRDFERPVRVARRAQGAIEAGGTAPVAATGFFYCGLSEELRESLVETARLGAEEARKEGRAAMQQFGEHKLETREDRLQVALDVAVEKHAHAKELFAAWQQQRAQSVAEVDAYLVDRPEAQQLEFLRKQIEMRVLGCGMTQYTTRWSSSSDVRIGTVAHLRELLDEIITEEMALKRLKRLPREAAQPQFVQRAAGATQLGTVDADVLDVEARAFFSADELERKVGQALKRRLEAGISDDVEDMQPLRAPAFDTLGNRRIEVLWKYYDKSNGNKEQLIWASGRVTRVADGKKMKRSARAKKVLPAGAVLWAWDADPEFGEAGGEQWLMLLPKKWNKHVHYGWRYDPRELGAQQGAEMPAGKRQRCHDESDVL